MATYPQYKPFLDDKRESAVELAKEVREASAIYEELYSKYEHHINALPTYHQFMVDFYNLLEDYEKEIARLNEPNTFLDDFNRAVEVYNRMAAKFEDRLNGQER